MTLQTAAAAKTASNTASIESNDMTDTLVMTEVINVAITEASTRTDTKEPIYAVMLDVDAVLSTQSAPAKLIQSDASTVMLRDVEETLRAALYRVVSREIVTRVGKPDKVKMCIAWD